MSRQGNGSVLSDEMSDGDDSSFGPAPPPPKHRNPQDIMMIASTESYEVEQEDHYSRTGMSYDDEETYDQSTDVEKADPPAEMTQDESGEDEADFEEDQSVEIPPTTVLQKMLMRENAPKKEGSHTLYAGIVACCLLIVVIILAAGYGSGAFKDDSSSSRAVVPDNEGVPTVPVPAPARSASPTPAPVPGETLSPRALMSQYLASVNVGGVEALADGNSPEGLALTWLSTDDPLLLDPTLASDQARIRQRYALLTIWFDSNDRWADESGWLVIEDECAGWFGVTCESQVVTSIDLAGNNVQGNVPADLALLTGLAVLNLANNIIGGEIPPSLATLPVLEELYLGGNLFSQDLSAYDFSGLQSLTVLELEDNDFSGSIPESIWTLSGLEFLILDDNEFSGELSGSISQLQNLRKYSFARRKKTVLDFTDCVLTSHLSFLFLCVVRFTVGNNNLSGAIPASMSDLTGIQTIWLFNNNFSGELFAGIDQLVNLNTFDVLGNSLTGALSTEFTVLPMLEFLYLGRNQFSGPIPDEYGNFPMLQLLVLESNQLTGAINPVLGNVALTSLRLGSNDFDQDDFPTFVYDMTSLVDLRLNNCQMSGSMDETIGNLVNLQILNVENNLLTGGIPDAVVDLTALIQFTAGNNVMRGRIPNAIGNLVSLRRLELEINRLTGALPASITDLVSLGTWTTIPRFGEMLAKKFTLYTHPYSI
jgi:Leucine-rich repeat (LRR) protein